MLAVTHIATRVRIVIAILQFYPFGTSPDHIVALARMLGRNGAIKRFNDGERTGFQPALFHRRQRRFLHLLAGCDTSPIAMTGQRNFVTAACFRYGNIGDVKPRCDFDHRLGPNEL